MLLIEPIALPARSRSKNQGRQKSWQWVKKQTQVQPIKQEPTHEKPKATIPYKSQQTKQIWVKKTLLQAQGFYQGQTSVWIPKQRLCTTNECQKQEPNKIKNQEPPQVLTNKNKPMVYRWQKKDQKTIPKKEIKEVNHKYKELIKQVWIKKTQSKLQPQDQQIKLPQQIKHIPSKKMQLRMAKLQALLFGMDSFKGNMASSATNCHLTLVT